MNWGLLFKYGNDILFLFLLIFLNKKTHNERVTAVSWEQVINQ